MIATETLGPAVVVRTLGPADADAIRALHAGMDEQDSYFRFFSAPPKNLAHVAAAIAQDDPTHCAVGAFRGNHLIGVANFVALEKNRSADVAMVVDHAEQEHGIGTRLLLELAEQARARGIERFVAEVLPANAKMMRLLRDAGFPITAHRRYGVERIGVQL